MEVSNIPLISIIIPIYNVAPYLPRCIDSILRQTHTNIEVILVNDGSTDASGNICDEYARMDGRVQVIHQKNSGVSAARNTGIDAASGEWFGFIDSDDWIEPQMYEKLWQTATVNNGLVSFCGTVIHLNDTEEGKQYCIFPDLPPRISKQQYFEYGLLNISFAASACTMLFNRKVFNEDKAIRFDITIRHWEDYFLVAQCLKKVEWFAYIPQAMYHYCKREDSASESFLNQKMLNDASQVYTSIIEMFKPASRYIAHLIQLQYATLVISWLLRTSTTHGYDATLISQLRKKVYRCAFTYLFSNKINIKPKLVYLSVMLCPKLAKTLWNILKNCIKISHKNNGGN